MTWVVGLVTILALISYILAPWGIANYFTSGWSNFIAWTIWAMLLAPLVIIVGLTPYRGQKAISKDWETKYEAVQALELYRCGQKAKLSSYLHLIAKLLGLSLGVNDSQDTVKVKLYLVSGLIEDLKLDKISVWLNVDGACSMEPWIIDNPPTLQAGKRSDELLPQRVQVKGEQLQEAINHARSVRIGGAFIKVRIILKDNKTPIELPQEDITIYFG